MSQGKQAIHRVELRWLPSPVRAEHREALVVLNTLYKEMAHNAIIRAGGNPSLLQAFQKPQAP